MVFATFHYLLHPVTLLLPPDRGVGGEPREEQVVGGEDTPPPPPSSHSPSSDTFGGWGGPGLGSSGVPGRGVSRDGPSSGRWRHGRGPVVSHPGRPRPSDGDPSTVSIRSLRNRHRVCTDEGEVTGGGWGPGPEIPSRPNVVLNG